jgi:hypothetical protein
VGCAATLANLRVSVRMQMHRRRLEQRRAGKAKGQEAENGNVERTSHVVGAIAEVRGDA